MSRRFLPLALIAVLVASPRVAASRLPANLVTIHMATPLVGWGTSPVAVLHTSDGGRHWQVVTPSIPWDRGYLTGYLPLDVIDGRSAWFEAPNSLGSKPATAVYLFHTTDAGKSWKRLPLLRLGQFSQIAQLQFVDRVHGWMIVIRDVGMSQISFDIYRTVDGGWHWQRTLEEEGFSGNHHQIGGGLPGLDLGQSYTFSGPTTGWVAGCFCGFGSIPEFFFHTTDGGHTWRPYHLPLPPAYRPGNAAVSAPIFFTHRVAVLPVYLLRRQGGRLFDAYQTSDGGQTWHGTVPVPVHADRYYDSFVDPRHGFVLDNQGLHRTADGGRHWQTLPFDFSRQDLMTVDFVTAGTGFILEGIGTSNRSRLYKTTDGGRSWHLVSSRLRMPRRSPPGGFWMPKHCGRRSWHGSRGGVAGTPLSPGTSPSRMLDGGWGASTHHGPCGRVQAGSRLSSAISNSARTATDLRAATAISSPACLPFTR